VGHDKIRERIPVLPPLFQKLVQHEEKKLNELKIDYDNVLVEIAQFAQEVMHPNVAPAPRKKNHSGTQLRAVFNEQIKGLEEEIDSLGDDGLAELERAKAKAGKRKAAVMKVLWRLEEDE